jgi:hypothetical protein
MAGNGSGLSPICNPATLAQKQKGEDDPQYHLVIA